MCMNDVPYAVYVWASLHLSTCTPLAHRLHTTEALLERRELKMLPKIAADFGKIASFERNELLVTVTTAGVRVVGVVTL